MDCCQYVRIKKKEKVGSVSSHKFKTYKFYSKKGKRFFDSFKYWYKTLKKDIFKFKLYYIENQRAIIIVEHVLIAFIESECFLFHLFGKKKLQSYNPKIHLAQIGFL